MTPAATRRARLGRWVALAVLLPACRCGPAPEAALTPPSAPCAACHRTIYDQWAESMHAHAIASPVTIVQNNLESRRILWRTTFPDPRRLCINCHAPVAAAVTEAETLPLPGGPALAEGIGCAACHKLRAAVSAGRGSEATEFERHYEEDNVFFGPLADPMPTRSHASETVPAFGDPDQLCGGCHNVHYDTDEDGKLVAGRDLVLQQTFDEHLEYRARGGQGTCVTCHMPVAAGVTTAIDGSLVDRGKPGIPTRTVHDHSFVGVDHRLDRPPGADPQRPARARLLESAATLTVAAPTVSGDTLTLVASLTNRSGHDLPTGFAFERQLWLEVVVKDGAGRPLLGSGEVARVDDDLCDGATYGEPGNALGAATRGCREVDRQLVNLQLKLVDKVAPAPADLRGGRPGRAEIVAEGGARETVLQELTGGAVVRHRPVDGASLAPLGPLETRGYSYTVKLPAGVQDGSWSVRLRFRSLPPCFLRVLAGAQPSDESPRLEPLIGNLQIVDLAARGGRFVVAARPDATSAR